MIPTEKLGNFLRENIKNMQTKVEDKLEVRLGKILIEPMMEQLESSACLNNKLPFAHAEVEENSDKSKIYRIGYSKQPSISIFNEINLQMVGFHELGHIAHHEIAGSETVLEQTSTEIFEGFADYVVELIMGAKALKNARKINSGRIEVGLLSQLKYYKDPLYEFKETLKKKGISTIPEIKEFLRKEK